MEYEDSLDFQNALDQAQEDARVLHEVIEALIADIVSCADESDGGKNEAEAYARKLVTLLTGAVAGASALPQDKK